MEEARRVAEPDPGEEPGGGREPAIAGQGRELSRGDHEPDEVQDRKPALDDEPGDLVVGRGEVGHGEVGHGGDPAVPRAARWATRPPTLCLRSGGLVVGIADHPRRGRLRPTPSGRSIGADAVRCSLAARPAQTEAIWSGSSSTRARAASARRASPPRPPSCARRAATGRSSSRPISPTASPTRWTSSSALSRRDRAEPVGPGARRLLQHRPLLADDPELRRGSVLLARPRRGARRGDERPAGHGRAAAICSGSPTTSIRAKFDVIVVDAAPTGETLRLLSLPEASRWWVERIAPIGKRVSRIGGPVIQQMLGVPMPREEVFKAAERLLRRLDALHKLLADPERLDRFASSSPSRRCRSPRPSARSPTSTCLATRAISSSPTASCPPMRAAYFAELARDPAAVPAGRRAGVRPGARPNGPVCSTARWSASIDCGRWASALFGDADPAEILYRGRPYEVLREADGYVLKLELPFAVARTRSGCRAPATSSCSMSARGGAASSCRGCSVDAPTPGAKMEGQTLRIQFDAPADAAPRAANGGRR